MSLEQLLENFHRELIAEIVIPVSRIAEAYQISRQGLTQLTKRNAITRDIIEDPDAMLEFLLENGNASPLRTKLLDADFRTQVGLKIDEAHWQTYLDRKAKLLKFYEPQFKLHAPPPLSVGSFQSAISPDSH